MKLGLVLPSFANDLDGKIAPRILDPFIDQAEKGPFDSLWVFDHLLVPKTGYSVSWLDPIAVLNYAAARSRRTSLGTSVIVLPLRNPVLLAKALCTLNLLSDERLIVGLGAGWYEDEFRACGIPMRERGPRTTEATQLLHRLMSEEMVTFRGRFYAVEDVTIHPRPRRTPPIWMGGGSSNGSKMPMTVARRIASTEGWLIRPLLSAEVVREDWEKIAQASEALGRDPDQLEISMVNYLHISTGNGEREQREKFERLMGSKRSWDYAVRHYLTGTVEEIAEKIGVLEEAGVKRLLLHPITFDSEQVDLWRDQLFPHI